MYLKYIVKEDDFDKALTELVDYGINVEVFDDLFEDSFETNEELLFMVSLLDLTLIIQETINPVERLTYPVYKTNIFDLTESKNRIIKDGNKIKTAHTLNLEMAEKLDVSLKELQRFQESLNHKAKELLSGEDNLKAVTLSDAKEKAEERIDFLAKKLYEEKLESKLRGKLELLENKKMGIDDFISRFELFKGVKVGSSKDDLLYVFTETKDDMIILFNKLDNKGYQWTVKPEKDYQYFEERSVVPLGFVDTEKIFNDAIPLVINTEYNIVYQSLGEEEKTKEKLDIIEQATMLLTINESKEPYYRNVTSHWTTTSGSNYNFTF